MIERALFYALVAVLTGGLFAAVLVLFCAALFGWMLREVEARFKGEPAPVPVPGVSSVEGPVAVPVAPARVAVPVTTLRVVSESGRKPLGTLRMPAKDRRPTVKRGNEVFMASHQEDSEWVYRRVGTERSAS
jgi:hypothetical protein